MTARWTAALALLGASLTAAPAQADPADSTPETVWFHDGPRRVEARRMGTSPDWSAGRPLTVVELRYPHLATPVPAGIDHTAIVQLEPAVGQDLERAQAALDGLGVRALKPLMPSIGLWHVEDVTGGDGLDAALRLSGPEAAARGIRQAIPDLYLRTERREPFVPNDPEFGGQWYFDNLNMTEAWGLTKGDPSTSIVIIDTGCDLTHPDLVAKLDPGRDVIDDDDDPSFIPGQEGAAHGTSCAGLAAADTDNEVGIAGGCPECRLRCVRLLTNIAHPVSDSVEAFDFGLQVGAAVLSNSWGYVDPIPVPQALADAINNVYANGRGGLGALVLFAAGNDNRELAPNEVEGVAGVLCIGAINNFDEQTPFTNYGSPVDLVAYTGTVTTDIAGPAGSDPGDYTGSFGGTSSACPVAAGIAGLIVSAAPERTAAELTQILIETARPAPYAMPDNFGHDPVYGFGIIDPVTTLRDGLGLTDPEPPDGGQTNGSDDSEDDSGCSLAPAPRQAPRLGWALLLVAVALGAGRRRRPSRRLGC